MITKRERALILLAFAQGYGHGHNDTVEGGFGDAEEVASDWLGDAESDGTLADMLAQLEANQTSSENERPTEHGAPLCCFCHKEFTPWHDGVETNTASCRACDMSNQDLAEFERDNFD